ncbi:chitinase [Amycolatopsis nigrescens]|uniref:chitinase n=1 Tax=Amycolatopsis nigrescens TaxID=381445 RepID=UPI00035D1A51|nr:chitinase [Amycolatopsis nigrescens]
MPVAKRGFRALAAVAALVVCTSAPAVAEPVGLAAVADLPLAPYVDMGSWPTPSLSEMSAASGITSYTLGFVIAAGCRASWFAAYDPRDGWQLDEIGKIRAAGGDVKISFGGASGVELAQACATPDSTFAEYDAVVKKYQLKYADFDIEGAAVADPASVQRRSAALAKLQQANPGLKISLTLPVLPTGLTADGLNVVRSAKTAGVVLDKVNVMAMDYYQGPADQGAKAIQAGRSTQAQLKTVYPDVADAELWRMVGVTPMLGQNDSRDEIFTQSDAQELVAFAGQQRLGMLSFWEMTRDRNACQGPLYKCTNVPQQPYEFAKIFAAYRG